MLLDSFIVKIFSYLHMHKIYLIISVLIPKLLFFTLYSLLFILYSLFFILYSLFFILYSLFFTLYSLFLLPTLQKVFVLLFLLPPNQNFLHRNGRFRLGVKPCLERLLAIYKKLFIFIIEFDF